MYPSRLISAGLSILCSLLLVFAPDSLCAAPQYFQFTSNTGSNATVILPETLQPTIEDTPLIPGDEIGVFTEAGLCVGAIVWEDTSQAITIWGNNPQTPEEKDGMDFDDSLYYRIWLHIPEIEVKNIIVTYDDSRPIYRTDGRYRTDAFYVLASIETFPGPPAPILISPEHESENHPVVVEFEWAQTPRTMHYTLQIARDSDFSEIAFDFTNINSTTYGVTELGYETVYFWRVRGNNLAGAGEWSEVRQFSTLFSPPAPDLIAPDDDAEELPVPVMFRWNETERTDSYRLQVARDTDFSTVVFEEAEITTTTIEVPELAFQTAYYWRVRAANVAGEGAWSGIRRFHTLTVPPAPVLISPEDGAEGLPIPVLFQWNETERTDSYRLQIADESDFSTLLVDESEITSTSFETSALDFETEYFWRLGATNPAGTGNWSETRRFTTIGTTIIISKPTTHTVWQENTTEAVEWTSRGVGQIRIELSIDNGTTWELIEASINSQVNRYDWTVSPLPSTEARIRLTDTEDENIYAVSPMFSIYPSRLSLTHTVSFGSPSFVTSYRMIGLPGNNNISMSSVMDGQAGRDWTVFRDTGDEEDYLIPYDGSTDFNFRPGRGFWVLSRNNFTIQTDENAVTLLADNTFSIPLHPGWNIISNPFEVSINWTTVQMLNDVNDPIWSYTGSFSQTNSFEPYRGYYYYNRDNKSSIAIPYPNGVLISKPLKRSPEMADRVNLSIEKDDSTFSDAQFIIADSKFENLDRYNIPAPPADFEETSIRLIHPATGKHHHTYIDTATNSGYEVTLAIYMQEGNSYLLKVDRTNPSDDGNMLLIHNRTGKIHSFEGDGTVHMSQENNKELYTLLMGDDAFIEHTVSKFIPDEITLSQNYPNPFNPYTTIEYSIPKTHADKTITLAVYNILGQRVRTLVNDRQPAGFYSVQWDARDDQAMAVPSGIYIYRLHAVGTIISKRMLLIK
jgi:hypothetical protein